MHCANTGISALINQKGERTIQTKWWVQTAINGTVNLNEKLTPYVKYGDYTGWIAVFIMILTGLYSLICAFPGRRRG